MQLTLTVPARPGSIDIAPIVQAQWRRHLGIEVRLKNLDETAWEQSLLRHQYRHAIEDSWTAFYEDPYDFLGQFGQSHYAATTWKDPVFDAALETADGTVVTGCNIENATYGLTICAERVAMFKALSDGHRRFTRIAIVADTDDPTSPCGPCRQILWEFGGDLEVILANLHAEKGRYRLHDLLPLPFDARLLGRKR